MHNRLSRAKQRQQVTKQVRRQSPPGTKRQSRWRGYVIDSLLVLVGVAFITVLIALAHLYPRVPTISFAYLLLVLALASLRGLYAAILASLLSFLAFDFFFFLPHYTFLVVSVEDLFTLVVFLATAIITGQLALALRRRIEQANSREQEMRLLYEQAQELAALQERQRLARELHDSVSQALYGIGLGTHTAREALESDPEQAKESMDYVLSLAEAGLAEMRALIFELRPESLASEGLVAALMRQVVVLRARYGLAVEVELSDEPAISPELKQTLYRVAQEALNNVVKHARASEVVVRIIKREDEIALEVQDNGRGFDPAASYPGHLGLHSMLERVTKPGGTLAIESAPDQGTCIRVRLPLVP